MARHHVKQNGIIYIIPDDELFRKLKNGEATIDKYGRLIDSKSHRVLRELEHFVDDRPTSNQQPSEEHPYRDAIIEGTAKGLRKVTYKYIDIGTDKLVNEVIPYLIREKVKPGLAEFREYWKNRRKPGAELRLKKSQPQEITSHTQLSVKSKSECSDENSMTEAEIIDEQRKAVLHYIGLLESLTKLHNAGVIDKENALEQLTNPAAIEQFNQALASNPNLLEMTKSNEISKLLCRDLFQGGELVPIEAKEIEEIAKNKNLEDT